MFVNLCSNCVVFSTKYCKGKGENVPFGLNETKVPLALTGKGSVLSFPVIRKQRMPLFFEGYEYKRSTK